MNNPFGIPKIVELLTPPKIPIPIDRITVNIVNMMMYLTFLPVRSIKTPNKGEKIISKIAEKALAYAIIVDEICSNLASVPIISVIY